MFVPKVQCDGASEQMGRAVLRHIVRHRADAVWRRAPSGTTGWVDAGQEGGRAT